MNSQRETETLKEKNDGDKPEEEKAVMCKWEKDLRSRLEVFMRKENG